MPSHHIILYLLLEQKNAPGNNERGSNKEGILMQVVTARAARSRDGLPLKELDDPAQRGDEAHSNIPPTHPLPDRQKLPKRRMHIVVALALAAGVGVLGILARPNPPSLSTIVTGDTALAARSIPPARGARPGQHRCGGW
jgi:hypothetical protein